eukprot:TRINITY_DN33363_c0_g1_i2.p1 TRINITY_DN33363_c0_g1~~TRINITY_DN33363_c0_g1_i2.p1  ORF type:complete len:981 (+),score=282.27 TRINITY_DN33363_c0_g1_i2:194-3136(+)
MQRMASTNVMLIGCRGLGVEIAKNLILAGVNSLTIYDPETIQPADLGAQFFLTEEDCGKPRAQTCVPRLKELNTAVTVTHTEAALTEQTISQYQVVVSTNNHSWSEMTALSELCHIHHVAFVAADLRGLAGMVFVDLGDKFEVKDLNGEPPRQCMIACIEPEEGGTRVTCTPEDDQPRHPFGAGDHVRFLEVDGMPELCEPSRVFRIQDDDKSSVVVEDLSAFGERVRGGYLEEVKQSHELSYCTMAATCAEPKLVMTDLAKFERPAQLHHIFQALYKWQEAHDGQLPVDAAAVDEFAAGVSADNFDLARKLASVAAAEISPMSSVIGGLVAQEVLKVCTAKFTPLDQWLYFDAFECLPDQCPADGAPEGSRYDSMAAIFGRERFQTLFMGASPFVVGAGALGCEILKNLAMMGVGTDGAVHVTDMDTIEVSNLSRQFLFREKDVGEGKSATAAAKVKEMNPHIVIRDYNDCMGKATEGTFNKDWWSEISLVVNALDNVEARLYMDARCVHYNKPLLEQGTLGTKGNTQVVIPHKTESYASSKDPPEQSFPVCTLKFYPYKIEHTIHWARDHFEGFYTNEANHVNAVIQDRAGFVASVAQVPNKVHIARNLCVNAGERPSSLFDCITWARNKFQALFSNEIQQLLCQHPAQSVTASGAHFWTPPKRCPTPLEFCAEDSAHLSFIMTSANLRAQVYGIERATDPAWVSEQLSKVIVKEFTPDSRSKVPDNDEEAKKEEELSTIDPAQLHAFDEVMAQLPDCSSAALVAPHAFEKDDDSNFHIDWITACSNLRASCYGISSADRNQTKVIAGKIIPAIATTTAMIAGLVCLELCKVVQNKPLEAYKNGFINLAINTFLFSEPLACKSNKVGQLEFSMWDQIVVDEGRDITLGELLKKLEKVVSEAEVDIDMIACMNPSGQPKLLYMAHMPKAKKLQRLAMPVSVLAAEVMDCVPESNELTLTIDGEDDDGEQVDLPPVRYHF